MRKSRTRTPLRIYSTDERGRAPVAAADYRQLAIRHLGLANHSKSPAICVAAAEVYMLAALQLTHEQKAVSFALSETRLIDGLARVISRLNPPRTMRVRVFHNVQSEALLNGYRAGDPLIEVYAYDQSDVDVSTGDLELAEHAFELFHIAHAPEHSKADHRAIEYRQRRNRMLATGDAVAIDGRFYGRDSSGWTLITDQPHLLIRELPGTTPFYLPQNTL